MSLFSAVTDFLKPAPAPSPQVRQALVRVAELVDPLLKAAGNFEKHLAFPVEHALGYCEGLVAALPGPLDLSHAAFAQDPLVNALFATAGDIDQMLGRSQAVRDFLALPACWEADHFYALFAARRQQKRQLGLARQGDVIRSDVPQTVLYFSDHTLIEPCCNLEVTRQHLRERALESLLLSFRDHVQALRHERDGLRSDVSIERAHLTVLRGSTPCIEREVSTRHLADLDTHLRTLGESLMPEQLVDALADFLHHPESSLKLKPHCVTVDRLGILHPDDDPAVDVHTLKFPELTTRDQRLHLVMLARIDRDEARAAVDLVRDQQHRFMLI